MGTLNSMLMPSPYHQVVRFLFYVKLCVPVIAYMLGSENWVWVLAFMVCNKVFSEAICRHGNLVTSALALYTSITVVMTDIIAAGVG